MRTVSVSREALQKIKIELGNFQTSMDSSTEHMKAHAEEVVVGVRNSIKKQQSLVTTLEKVVTKLAGEIEQRQAQIINNNNKLNTLTSNIAAGKAQSSGMDQRISQLQSRKQQLISHGSANSDNGGNDNSGQINAIGNQIRECDNQRRRLNEQIASMQSQQNELNRQNDQLRDEKARKEAEFSTAKGELNKAREKNEKMKSAGAVVESKTGDLLGVVQHFKQNVTTTSSKSKSGIEKCIAAIDEYMSTNIIGVGAGGRAYTDSMSSPSELAQIAEMEANGEFSISEVELMNASRSASGQRLTQTPMTLEYRVPESQSGNEEQIASQLRMQEDGFNLLTVGAYLRFRAYYVRHGRNASSADAQHRYRLSTAEVMMEDYMENNSGASSEEARLYAEIALADMDALHNPDQGMGGDPMGVNAIGARGANRSIGRMLSGGGQAEALYEQVRRESVGLSAEELEHTFLNVRINITNL